VPAGTIQNKITMKLLKILFRRKKIIAKSSSIKGAWGSGKRDMSMGYKRT
jgi:hypothetical protein